MQFDLKNLLSIKKIIMKRVIFVISTANSFGGIQVINETLINRIAEKNKYQIELVSIFKDSDNIYLNLNPHIKVHYIFGKTFNIKRNFFKFILGVRNFFNKLGKIDVLIISDIGYATPFSIALPFSIPTIFWDHQGFLLGKKFGLGWLGRRIAAYKKNFHIVCLTQSSLNLYRKTFGENIPISQIYNPSSTKIPDSTYNANTRKIISCGRFTEQKGFDFLVEIAKKFFDMGHKDWQWHIYGDGPMLSEIKSKTYAYSLENNIKFMGYTSNISLIYKNYSIFALTSRYEGFPLVFLEAISSGLPSISFDCDSGPSELMDEGKSGFLVKCFDTDEFAKKLDYMVSNVNLEKFSKVAKEFSTRFPETTFVKKWDNLIQTLANKD